MRHALFTEQDCRDFLGRILYELKDQGDRLGEEVTQTKLELIVGDLLKSQGRVITTPNALHENGIQINFAYEYGSVISGVLVLEKLAFDKVAKTFSVVLTFDNE